ncbi:hypothetical protein KRX57_07945 [Weeksellaceae bacterium TAE3-ERU29]|nr:hypothetical protein [Weeksellaceae bacterium TAE3-ERU29]
MKCSNYFFAFVLFLLMTGTMKAQEVNPETLPSTIKEFRVHVPGIVSFGMYKPLNQKDLVGAKVGGGFVFPAVMGGVFLEYRHYFSEMNNQKDVSKGSFLYAVKPYFIHIITSDGGPNAKAKHNNMVGVSGAFGYEWKLKSGFFFRPAVEPNIPIINDEEGTFWEATRGMTISQTFLSTVSIGFKW